MDSFLRSMVGGREMDAIIRIFDTHDDVKSI
jgi:hypothetical protein